MKDRAETEASLRPLAFDTYIHVYIHTCMLMLFVYSNTKVLPHNISRQSHVTYNDSFGLYVYTRDQVQNTYIHVSKGHIHSCIEEIIQRERTMVRRSQAYEDNSN